LAGFWSLESCGRSYVGAFGRNLASDVFIFNLPYEENVWVLKNKLDVGEVTFCEVSVQLKGTNLLIYITHRNYRWRKTAESN
jgi:hypothetical protein